MDLADVAEKVRLFSLLSGQDIQSDVPAVWPRFAIAGGFRREAPQQYGKVAQTAKLSLVRLSAQKGKFESGRSSNVLWEHLSRLWIGQTAFGSRSGVQMWNFVRLGCKQHAPVGQTGPIPNNTTLSRIISLAYTFCQAVQSGLFQPWDESTGCVSSAVPQRSWSHGAGCLTNFCTFPLS